jgi:hypothetical protein
LRVVDVPSAFPILKEHGARLITTDVSCDSNPTPCKDRDPTSRLGAFIEAYPTCILFMRTAYEAAHPGPVDGAKTHDAWLRAGNEFALRHAGAAEIVMAEESLRKQECYDFGVSD